MEWQSSFPSSVTRSRHRSCLNPPKPLLSSAYCLPLTIHLTLTVPLISEGMRNHDGIASLSLAAQRGTLERQRISLVQPIYTSSEIWRSSSGSRVTRHTNRSRGKPRPGICRTSRGFVPGLLAKGTASSAHEVRRGRGSIWRESEGQSKSGRENGITDERAEGTGRSRRMVEL